MSSITSSIKNIFFSKALFLTLFASFIFTSNFAADSLPPNILEQIIRNSNVTKLKKALNGTIDNPKGEAFASVDPYKRLKLSKPYKFSYGKFKRNILFWTIKGAQADILETIMQYYKPENTLFAALTSICSQKERLPSKNRIICSPIHLAALLVENKNLELLKRKEWTATAPALIYKRHFADNLLKKLVETKNHYVRKTLPQLIRFKLKKVKKQLKRISNTIHSSQGVLQATNIALHTLELIASLAKQKQQELDKIKLQKAVQISNALRKIQIHLKAPAKELMPNIAKQIKIFEDALLSLKKNLETRIRERIGQP